MCVLYLLCVYGDGDILCKDPSTPSLGLTVALANSIWWIECRAKQVPVDPWSYLSHCFRPPSFWLALETQSHLALLTLDVSTSSVCVCVCVCVCVRALCVRACVCVRKRESLDTKLCFQLNNSAPFQQYQDPGGREQKESRRKAEGRRWRELVALRTAVIILPVLSAECSCHISVGTELKDECSLPSFSLFLSDSYRYRILYLYHFPALAFCLIQKN